MNILGVTLARGGSKSIVKKNIVKIHNRPLIQFTVDEAMKSAHLTDYIINTDCEEIYACCVEFCANVQFGRPEKLSTDTASSGETLKYVVERYEEETSSKVDIVVELMATNPLKVKEDIDACIELMISKNAETVIALGRLYDHHPSRMKYLDQEGYIKDFYPETIESRRQDLTPPAFVRAGSVYVMKRTVLDENRRYGGANSIGYVLPDARFVNIDEPNDLYVVERMLESRC